MAEFSSLDGQNQSIPFSGGSVNPMQLTTPNSMITGTMAGLQQIGSPSLTVDSVKNLITIKPISTANTQILRYGQIATGFLGMAVNDGTNDTMFVGQDNTGATVIKIAKTGFDAKTASASNLILNSGQNVFKIVATGNSQLPSSGAIAGSSNSGFTLSTIIPHNLGFVPIAQVYVQLSSSFYISGSFQGKLSYIQLPILNEAFGAYDFPNVVYTGTSGDNTKYLWFAIDNTNLYVQYYFTTFAGTGTTTSGIVPFKYYLLQETAN